MSACNSRGLHHKADEIYQHIQTATKYRPDQYTYGAALVTAAQEGNSKKSIEILQSIKKSKVELNLIHYSNAITAWYANQTPYIRFANNTAILVTRIMSGRRG